MWFVLGLRPSRFCDIQDPKVSSWMLTSSTAVDS
jgi:hypothetical protein